MSSASRMARCAVASFALLAGAASAQDLYRLATGDWIDDAERAYRLDTLYGTPTVITMAYGACRRICSSGLRMLLKVQALADERGHPINVVVGLDPRSDRPQDWAALRAEHGLMRANWHFLSGGEAQTRRLAAALGIRYWRYGGHTLHDLRIVLLSERAVPLRFVDTFDAPLESLLP